MSTKHEFCDCLDCTECDSTLAGYDPCDCQQMYEEAESEKAAELRAYGAKQALDELKLYLLYCGVQDGNEDLLAGIQWAVDAIDRRLSDLEVTPKTAFAEGGAA